MKSQEVLKLQQETKPDIVARIEKLAVLTPRPTPPGQMTREELGAEIAQCKADIAVFQEEFRQISRKPKQNQAEIRKNMLGERQKRGHLATLEAALAAKPPAAESNVNSEEAKLEDLVIEELNEIFVALPGSETDALDTLSAAIATTEGIHQAMPGKNSVQMVSMLADVRAGRWPAVREITDTFLTALPSEV